MSAADRAARLRDWLRPGGPPVIGSGAWGTELRARGLSGAAWADAWNTDRPDAVAALARAYCTGGADYLVTNTFGANALNAARFGRPGAAPAVAAAGARIAREAAGEDRIVLGAMGPAADPAAADDESALPEVFREQAAALLENGCDGILVETMGNPDEARTAVEAARAAGAEAVWCLFAFAPPDSDGAWRTYRGAPLGDAVAAAREAGADVVGANCMLGPGAMARLAPVLLAAADKHPCCMRPCADGTTPGLFARGLELLGDLGIALLGGCCGAGPDHIAAATAHARASR